MWAQFAQFGGKWTIWLGLGLGIVYLLAGTIVDVAAYLQPKVIINNGKWHNEALKDRTRTVIKTTTKPDGTIEKLEEIQTALDKLTVDKEEEAVVKEPVAIAGKPSLWAIQGAYAPLQREISLGLGFQLLPSLVLGIGCPVAQFEGDAGIQWASGFRPNAWATWTLPGFR